MDSKSHIIHVNLENFSTEVVEKSKQVPVLVDFTADWCAPCRVLMPILNKLVEEYQGQFVLAKVDTDEEQKLAGQHGVRGFPTLKLYRHGQIVDEAQGMQPESVLRNMIDQHTMTS